MQGAHINGKKHWCHVHVLTSKLVFRKASNLIHCFAWSRYSARGGTLLCKLEVFNTSSIHFTTLFFCPWKRLLYIS